MVDVTRVGSGSVVLGWLPVVVIPTVVVITVMLVVSVSRRGLFTKMAVADVQASRFAMVVGRLVNVCQAGHGTEGQVEGTAGQCDDSAHTPDSIGPQLKV